MHRLFGKKYTNSPPFSCDDCLTNKAHRQPHPRRSKEAKAKRDGTGPYGEFHLDIFSWPFPGEHGERYGAVLWDSRRIIPIAEKTKAAVPDTTIQELRKMTKLRKEGVRSLCITVHSLDVMVETLTGKVDVEMTRFFLRQ